MDADDDLSALDELKVYAQIIRDGLPPRNASISRESAEKILTLAFRAIADKDAEISRLTAELDDARNVPVEYVPTAGVEAAMAADPAREDGALLRETGGLLRAWAWKAAAKEWEQLP